MSNKIVDKDGNVYVKKKPFYKKWWFWLLAVIVVVGAFGSQGSSSTTTSSSGTQQATKPENKGNTAKLGEKITFNKEAEITVKEAVWTEERNSFTDSQETPPKKVLLVTYDVKNLKDTDYAVGGELNLYVNGKKAKTYPIQVTMEAISSNRVKENATQAFRVDEEGTLELEVQPAFSFSSDKKVIKLEL